MKILRRRKQHKFPMLTRIFDRWYSNMLDPAERSAFIKELIGVVDLHQDKAFRITIERVDEGE